jgi:hypothetical protein
VEIVAHTVSRELGAGVEATFDVVVAEDVLPKVLHRWGPVPGVRGTRGLTGPWDAPGSSRTVLLEDGNTAREQLLVWERPARFEYRVDQLTSALGLLIDHALGSWEFGSAAGGSWFRWTYAFVGRGPVSAMLLVPVVRIAWAPYMEQCAEETVRLAVRQSEL